MPTVTVVVPSYNHAKYLRECVDSALGQTLGEVEVIVLDDGSTDGSVEILESYGSLIRFERNPANLGTYPTLNRGLGLATGEYVAILNSDDVWEAAKLERQVDQLATNPDYVFCHTFGVFIDGDGTEVAGTPMGFPFPRVASGNILHCMISNNCAIASSVLIRTATARKVGGFDGGFRNLGDWDMWLRLAELGPVGFVDEKLTRYRVHSANTIYATETTRAEEARIRRGLHARARELRERCVSDAEADRAFAHSYACLGSLESLAGDPRAARSAYRESMKLMPGRLKTYLRYVLSFAPMAVRRRLV